MDEKQYRENQTGYDKDTFGDVNRNHQQSYSQGYTQGNENRNNYSQDNFSQNSYGQNTQQTSRDSGSFYYSSSKPAGNGFGIASMVLGILALVFFCGCINIPLAIISIIFAIIHINRNSGSKGFAIAGIVTSAISVILTVIMILAFMYAGTASTSWMYSETMPFEYFSEGDDFWEDFSGDYEGSPDEDIFDGHHHGQDL